MEHETKERCAKAVKTLAKGMPLATRLKFATEFLTLMTVLDVGPDLLEDQRKNRPKVSDEELRRRRIERYELKTKNPDHDKTYYIEYRDAGTEIQCNIFEAAKLFGLAPNSLRRYVSLHKKFVRVGENEYGQEDTLLIYRCNLDGSPRYKDIKSLPFTQDHRSAF